MWRPGGAVSGGKYYARLDAASHLDEMIEASEWESTEENKKPLERPNRGDVDKRTVTVEIPVWDEAGKLADTQVWEVTLTVPQDKRTGQKTAYDLLLREKKKDTHSVRALPQKVGAVLDRASFEKTIAENLELVKPQRTFPANGGGRQLLTARQEEQLVQAQKMAEEINTAKEVGGVKYSIVKDGEGNPRVIVDRDIFQGVDAADRPQKLKEFLMNNLRGQEYTALSDGEILSVAQKNQTLQKMWKPGYPINERKYHARLDAASHLDEMIEASEWESTEENKKPLERPNRGDVDKRTVTVEIPVWDEAGNLADTQVWEVTLVVPQDKRTGRKTAYDLLLREKKKDAHSARVLLQKQEAAIDRASFKGTIAENLELVKPQGTFPANGDGRQLLTAKQEEELRQAQKLEEQEKKRYSINERFRNDVMEWHREGEPLGERFILGDTGPVLQGLGAIESDIYMNGDKISKIMHDHPEITIREIQRIPEILEDPVLILKSKGKNMSGLNSRLVLFGSIKAENGQPIMAVLDLRPHENGFLLNNVQKVNSTYTKDHPVRFLMDSEVLHADKKRTIPLLRRFGLTIASRELLQNGSIGSIVYHGDSVKLKGVPFSSVVKSGANSQKKVSIKEDGSELKHLRSERKEVRDQIGNLEWLEERNNGLSDADAAELRGLREQERMLNEKIEQAREAAKETELPETERIRAAAERVAGEVKPQEAYKSLRAALLDTFHVQAGNRKDLGNQIDHVAQQILEKGYATASDEAELCRALYNAGVVVDTSASESYAGIRKDLRKAKIYVDDTVRAELGDDWNDMRKRAFANGIILTTDSNTGQGIDQLHADLADYYPGMFDAQSTDRTAMLEEMISAAELGKPEHISLMEAAMREGGTDAVESQRAFFDRYLSNELQKFSDQAGFEMRIKADSIRKNAKLKALIVEAETRKQMQKYTKETQDKTIRMVKWLRKKMKYADANLHQVLEEMDPQERETVEQLIETLSTEAKHLTEYRAAQFAENAAFYESMMQNNPDYIPSKQTLDTIAKMDAVYIKDNFTTEQLYAVYQTLREAQHQLVNLEKTLAQENAKKFSELYEQGKSEIDRAKGKLYLSEADMAALPMGKSTAERLKSWATLQQMTPVNVFSMMGGWKKESVMTEMADAFVRGEQKMQAYQNGAEALLADFIKKNEKWIETADGQGKKGEWIKYEVPKIMEWGAGNTPITSDETVTFWMTPAQRAYLYLESRNSDNMRHIAYGGHTFPDKALYTAGKKKQAMSSGVTVKLSPSMVESICKDMTPQEKEIAHIIGDLYFDAYSKKAYNETTQLLYGHDGAIGTHYAQIISNRNYLSQEPTKIDGSIGSVGFNHERVVSKTPTIAASIFDVFEAHSADMAKFVGMAAPVRDMSILMNYTEVGKSGSMRDTITRKWGDGGVEYIDNLMKNLQFREPERMSLLDAVVNKGWNNYVSAIFAANPGIVLKQMSSYPMAGAILGFDTMPKTAMLKSAYRKYRPIINRYSQLLQEREKGYSTRELAEMRRNPGKFQQWVNRDHAGSSSKIRRAEGKAKKFLLGGGAIQWMDCHAVSAIWPWAENYVKKHEPNLEPGTEEFYTRVAKVWEDTVYNTQAVYDEMHRAEVLKSSGAIQKSLTMFHSDMIQQQNILRKKIAEYRADPSMENKKGVQRTVQGVVMSAAFYVALNFLGKLMSGRNDDYRDKDGELTPMSIAEGALWDFAVSTAGLMPGVDAMLEAVEHKVHGNSWGTAAFDVPSVDAINDLLKDTTNLLETGWIMAEGGGESTTENAKAFAKAIRKMAYTAATLLGVPVKNTEKYLMSVINVVAPELSVRYNSLFGDIGKDALEGKHGRVLRANLKILTRDNMGLPSARVEMELERLYQTEAGADILPNAAAPDSVKLPLVDQQGKAILNEDGEVQKEEIMLRAGDKEKYRKAYKNFVTTELHKMVGSAEYKNLTDEEKSRAIEMLYQYAADQAKGAAVDGYKTESSWKANAAAAIKDGATVAQVLAYKAATATMTGEPDGKGGTVAGSLGAKKTDWLQESGWNEKAQAAIYFNMQSETARKKLAEMQKAGVDQSTYYRYLMGTEDITSDYDENGNTIHGSKNKKLYAYLNQMHLTEEQKVGIYLTEIKDFREDLGYKKAAAEGVTDWQYASFATNTGAMTTEKKHGKTVVSRRDKVLGYIDQMPISYEAKDALYYDAGYKESTIHDAPWHGGTIRSSSSGGSSGNRSRGRAGTGSSKRKGPSKADQKKAQKDAAREAAMNSPAVQAYLNRGKQYANGQQMNIYFGNRMLPRAGERVQKGRLPTAREIEEVRNYIKKYGNSIDIEVMEKYLNRFEG